jgi:formylglycine-generating enzyme required for sulfatase activity
MSHRLTAAGIRLLARFTLLFLTAVGAPTAAQQPATDEAAVALRQFNAAIADAAVYRKENLRRLVPLKFDARSGTARVVTLTAEAYPKSGPHTLGGDVWVTAEPEVRDKCKRVEKDPAVFLRQLLGLHPNTTFTHFVVMDVKKADVFRPAPDPETTTEWPCPDPQRGRYLGQLFPDGVSDHHVRWMANQMLSSYLIAQNVGTDGYPWTRLGYTYNWKPGADRYGCSEYVVRKNAVVTIDEVIPYREYCAGASFVGLKAGNERSVAGVRLCWCPAGRFVMGSPPNEPERRPDEGQVEVTLSKGFWMAKYELTQGQWKRVAGKLPDRPTDKLPENDNLPVGNVNFAEAETFCRKLTEHARASGELPAGWEFRLPTEAQWEYACRAGTTTATAFGDKLSSTQANFKGEPYNGAGPGPSLGRAAVVGSYPANAWGLHDMHGNTYEWCRDWYHVKLPGGVDPDLHGATAKSRVRRGGCWEDDGWPCRSAFRVRFEPERRHEHIGFRVVAVRP